MKTTTTTPNPLKHGSSTSDLRAEWLSLPISRSLRENKRTLLSLQSASQENGQVPSPSVTRGRLCDRARGDGEFSISIPSGWSPPEGRMERGPQVGFGDRWARRLACCCRMERGWAFVIFPSSGPEYPSKNQPGVIPKPSGEGGRKEAGRERCKGRPCGQEHALTRGLGTGLLLKNAIIQSREPSDAPEETESFIDKFIK